ncbi:MAG: ABC transporter permease subunit, partial [Acidiferrobacterales bacterium]|nr:ABC transporter permease subunit [Acidiferrobacterales bacterium]
TGIFRTWFGLGDSAAAAQLAAVMMLFVFALIVIEQRSRRRARYYHIESRARPLPSYTLSGMRAAMAFAVCLLPFALGFLLPAGQLLWWSVQTASATVDKSFIRLVVNTLSLAGSAAMFAVLVSLLMAYGRRLSDNLGAAFAVRLAGMGYAVPGVVIAVGVMLPFTWLDNAIDAWTRAHFGISTGLLLSGTLFMLIFAYMVRFLAVALQTVEAGLGKITRSMDEVARSFGYRPLTVIGQVHVPIMRASLLTAIILVFVDVMKELPATLILRPFDFNTLAVRTYELASDERLADASTAALAIVLVGIIPVLLLSRSIARSRRSEIGPAQLDESLAVAP